jgi:hypothetical protein
MVGQAIAINTGTAGAPVAAAATDAGRWTINADDGDSQADHIFDDVPFYFDLKCFISLC